MQALKGELWIESKLGYELNSCVKEKRRVRRKSILGFEFPFCHGRNSGFLLLASNSRAIGYGGLYRRPKFDLECGFLCGQSRLKVAGFCKHRKMSRCRSVTMALALEEQAIGNGFRLEEFDSKDDLVDKSKSDSQEEETGNEFQAGRVNVRELAASLRLAKTVDEVNDVLKDKGDLPLQVYSTVIRGLGKDKLFVPAFAVFEWIKRRKDETDGAISPNLFTYNSLLGAVKQCGRFSVMDKVLNDMAREGVAPNIVTYNTKMAIYLEKGEFRRALAVLDEMREKGFMPSSVSYSTAMLAYRRMEDGIGAVRFFVEVREKYESGEVSEDDGRGDRESELDNLKSFTARICYQVMRNRLVKEGDSTTDVLKLLTTMDNAGIPPGKSEQERLLWACTREEHALVAKELYDRIRERWCSEISLSVCNHTMWLMGKAKKWWTALEIYEDLLDKGPKPNNMSNEIIVSHFNTLLGAARRRGIWKWGVRLLDKMEERGLKPGSKEWNAVLVACSKASEASAAVEIFSRMVERGQKPTILSYGALLSALEKGKLYDEARQVWEHMLKVGVKPNVYAYTIMASVFAGQGKINLVETVLREMAESGVEPTVVTYNAIISGLARREGASGEAFEWFRRMKGLEIGPNNVTYEMLIEVLAKDSKPRLAYELYLRARNEGVELAPKAYDAVVESSEMVGATIDLRLLGVRPLDRRGKSIEIED